MKLILTGSLLITESAEKQVLQKIKEKTGLEDLTYNNNNLILIGGKTHIIKAIRQIGKNHIINITEFEGDLASKNVKSAIREGKEEYLSELMVKEGLSYCYGNMVWRFITPKTKKEQYTNMIQRFIECSKCKLELFNRCASHSILRKLEEKKWLEE